MGGKFKLRQVPLCFCCLAITRQSRHHLHAPSLQALRHMALCLGLQIAEGFKSQVGHGGIGLHRHLAGQFVNVGAGCFV